MSLTILAVDQSSDSSGWAVRRDGSTRAVGLARDAEARRIAVKVASTVAGNEPLIAVLEDHRSFAFSRGNMSVKSLLGMGAARGRWEQALESAGVTDVRMVEPKVWRRAVLGMGASVSGMLAKEAAKQHAYAVLGVGVDDDVAEALCIALWAERNVEPKKRRKAARR